MTLPRPLRPAPDGGGIEILDQTLLPHEERWCRLGDVEAVAEAIRAMRVRGAPLIGITAAWGMALAMQDDPSDAGLAAAARRLLGARPTAVNLRWAVERIRSVVGVVEPGRRADLASREAARIGEEDVAVCRAIGEHGLGLLRTLRGQVTTGHPIQVMTHCNAGWLAALEYGTALAPVYRAAESGLPVHVWVSETRPRNQGWLTAWELNRAGIPHTVMADNAAGHLLQGGAVDVVLVGTDRTAANGDVCNKVGTLLKAHAARAAGVPFYAAVPSPSIDWHAQAGAAIAIEERSAEEVLTIRGRGPGGAVAEVALGAAGTPAHNPAFDVTPAALITGLITERGICPATRAGLAGLFPERGP